ncbi:hypothetical protein F4781DRAFT_413681 [Annulohypoxylon bovei var. microspora]|nr:hypothetical protein F4781DRAFT_413681 [Annulohypoxylon bovei var. microspora]
MSFQVPSSDIQSRPIERAESLKSTGRLRSACDSCHQAKIRCSGGNPCLTCLVSQVHCTYSPGSRLGRPKGSKNKRPTVKENKNRRDETLESNNTNSVDSSRGSDAARRREAQQQSDPMPVEFDDEHGFHSGITEDLLNPSLTSFIDSISGTHMQTSLEGDSNATFGRTGNAEDQSPYHDLAFGTPRSTCDSGYTTATINSYADDAALSSPGSAISDGKQKHSGTGSLAFREPSRCPCLQQQVHLVYQLGDLQYSGSGSPTIDSILQGVQLAQAPWKALMECGRCQRKEDQKEGFLLFATSIRILLSLFQKLNTTPQKSDTLHGTVMDQKVFPFALDINVSVGNFKLLGGMKEEVIEVVIRRALQSVTAALLHLWERVDRPRLSPIADQNGGGGTGDAPESPVNMDLQEHQQQSDFSPNFGSQDIRALLNSLYSIMQVIKQDL